MNVSLPVILLFCGVLVAIVLIMFLPSPRSWAKAKTPSKRQRPNIIYRDDDRYWYGGFFYNNPDDPDPIVPKRFGFGWTLNFGHPVGRLILIVTLLLPLVLLILNFLLVGIAPIGCHPSGCYPLP